MSNEQALLLIRKYCPDVQKLMAEKINKSYPNNSERQWVSILHHVGCLK